MWLDTSVTTQVELDTSAMTQAWLGTIVNGQLCDWTLVWLDTSVTGH
jgi:hypothetical protein